MYHQQIHPSIHRSIHPFTICQRSVAGPELQLGWLSGWVEWHAGRSPMLAELNWQDQYDQQIQIPNKMVLKSIWHYELNHETKKTIVDSSVIKPYTATSMWANECFALDCAGSLEAGISLSNQCVRIISFFEQWVRCISHCKELFKRCMLALRVWKSWRPGQDNEVNPP